MQERQQNSQRKMKFLRVTLLIFERNPNPTWLFYFYFCGKSLKKMVKKYFSEVNSDMDSSRKVINVTIKNCGFGWEFCRRAPWQPNSRSWLTQLVPDLIGLFGGQFIFLFLLNFRLLCDQGLTSKWHKLKVRRSWGWNRKEMRERSYVYFKIQIMILLNSM